MLLAGDTKHRLFGQATPGPVTHPTARLAHWAAKARKPMKVPRTT